MEDKKNLQQDELHKVSAGDDIIIRNGSGGGLITCPKCYSTNCTLIDWSTPEAWQLHRCNSCGQLFKFVY